MVPSCESREQSRRWDNLEFIHGTRWEMHWAIYLRGVYLNGYNFLIFRIRNQDRLYVDNSGAY